MPAGLRAGLDVVDYLFADHRGQLLTRYPGDNLTVPPRAITGALLMLPGVAAHDIVVFGKPVPAKGRDDHQRTAPRPVDGPDPREQTVAAPRDGAATEGEDQSPHQEKSSYHAALPGRPGPEPLNVRIELVLMNGPEGKQLRMRQAAAIREAMRWFAQHPNPRQTTQSS